MSTHLASPSFKPPEWLDSNRIRCLQEALRLVVPTLSPWWDANLWFFGLAVDRPPNTHLHISLSSNSLLQRRQLMTIYVAGSILLLSEIMACSASRTPMSTRFLPNDKERRHLNLQNDFTYHYRSERTCLLPSDLDSSSTASCRSNLLRSNSGCNASPFRCAVEARERMVIECPGTRRRSFYVHNRILWPRFGWKPFDEKEKRGWMLGCWGRMCILLAFPFASSVSRRSLHQRNLYCVSLGCHRIRNRSFPKGPRGHDEFVPAARALDRQLYFLGLCEGRANLRLFEKKGAREG